MINIIAATTQNGVIGYFDGSLPFNYKEDLSHFKKMTKNSTIIMGRKTFEAIGKPLPNRQNIIVTANKISNIESSTSLKEAINMAINENVWLIGGFSIYNEGMNYADNIYLTITPDISNKQNQVYFPWINPFKFELHTIMPFMDYSNKLNLAIYKSLK